MGTDRVTTQNLLVVRVDTLLNLLYVKGCVPGADNGHVLVRDAKRKIIAAAKRKLGKGATDLSACLPAGVDSLPFLAGTKEIAEPFKDYYREDTRAESFRSNRVEKTSGGLTYSSLAALAEREDVDLR